MTEAPSGVWRTAGLFARLKLRILRNGLRRGGGGRAAGAVMGWVFAVVIGLVALVAGIGLRTRTRADGVTTATLLGAGAAAAGLLLPVLLLGIDESISPDRLVLYPLRPSRRLIGLAVSALLSPVALAVALTLVGLAIGLTRSVVGVVVVVAAAAALLVTCIVLSRVLPTLLSGVLSSRRGRDAAFALASLVGFSGFVVQYLVSSVRVSRSRFEHLASIARWSPPGALGRAMAHAGAGRLGVALAELAFGLLGLTVAAAAWGWGLGRLDRRVPSTSGPKRRAVAAVGAGEADEAGEVPLFGRSLRWLPATAVGAVAARELRYLARDPRRRAASISVLVIGVVVPLLNNVQRGHDASASVLFSAGAAWFAVLNAMNQFGIDGRSLWFDLLSGISPKRLLLGKNLAHAVAVVPIVALASVVLAVITGGWAYVPAAIVTGLGTVSLGLGVANVTSVLVPYPVPEGSNPFAMKNTGQGCISGFVLLGAVLVMSLLLVPVVIGLAVERGNALACLGVGVASVPYGLVLRAAGAAIAATRLRDRPSEIIIAVHPNR